jgi:hypothetical protein
VHRRRSGNRPRAGADLARQRAGFGAGVRRKGGPKTLNRLPQHGVAPLRHDIAQRRQNKGAFVHTRMGQNKLVWCLLQLTGGVEIAPVIKCPPVRHHLPAKRDQIKVERAAPPALNPVAAKISLDSVQNGQQ